MNIHKSLKIVEVLVVSREFKKWNFLPRDIPCSKFKIWHIPDFVWMSQMIKGTFLSFSLITDEWIWMNIYSWTSTLLKDFREPLLSFKLIHFRNFFYYRIENNWSFRNRILSRVAPLRTNLISFVSLGITWIPRSSKLSIYFEVVLLKSFLEHFELCFYYKYLRSYEVI